MDFTLALTHFCEAHGPKSVLCTQIQPLECARCAPPPSRRERLASFESYTTEVGREDGQKRRTPVSSIRRSDTDETSPQTLSQAATTVETSTASPHIEQHPLFRRGETNDQSGRFPYGRIHGETCASCSFTVPHKVAAKLPEGAPGSLPKDGKTKTSAPVLRSREFVCLGKGRKRQAQADPSSSQESQGTCASSFGSTVSHSNCHDHTLTYLTAKSPDDPENYAQLRASVIRALSCEVLPRGMSEGPFCFGDSTSGYTIAYIFRLTDPKARGRRRAYAFVALAGKDAHRAFKACPMLWEAFTMMSKTIEQAAQRYQDEEEAKYQKEQEEQMAKDTKAGYTNISSFLTQRPRDPDGQPRRAGQTQPRSLADIIGDENIFAILHQYFVHVLRCLGDKFGGMPLADPRMVYQTTANDSEGLADDTLPSRVSTEMLAALSLDEKKTPSPTSGKNRDGATTKEDLSTNTNHNKSPTNTNTTTSPSNTETRSNSSNNTVTPQLVKRNSQCAPKPTDSAPQRQVAV